MGRYQRNSANGANIATPAAILAAQERMLVTDLRITTRLSGAATELAERHAAHRVRSKRLLAAGTIQPMLRSRIQNLAIGVSLSLAQRLDDTSDVVAVLLGKCFSMAPNLRNDRILSHCQSLRVPQANRAAGTQVHAIQSALQSQP